MLLNHEPQQFELGKRLSFAYQAKGPPTSLIVFVHGFTGDAVATWEGFREHLLTSNDFVQSDIVFYGYDSLYKQVVTSANCFRQFMDAVSQSSEGSTKQLERVRDAFVGRRHSRVIFVCHSLGAVIVRRAVLDCVDAVNTGRRRCGWEGANWMLLFGPAHAGGRPIGLANSALAQGQFLPALASFAQYLIPVLEGLRPDGQTIRRLFVDTERLQHTGLVNAKVIVFGENDKVVYREPPYQNDPLALDIFGEDHVSICKPRANFQDPLEILAGALP